MARTAMNKMRKSRYGPENLGDEADDEEGEGEDEEGLGAFGSVP